MIRVLGVHHAARRPCSLLHLPTATTRTMVSFSTASSSAYMDQIRSSMLSFEGYRYHLQEPRSVPLPETLLYAQHSSSLSSSLLSSSSMVEVNRLGLDEKQDHHDHDDRNNNNNDDYDYYATSSFEATLNRYLELERGPSYHSSNKSLLFETAVRDFFRI